MASDAEEKLKRMVPADDPFEAALDACEADLDAYIAEWKESIRAYIREELQQTALEGKREEVDK